MAEAVAEKKVGLKENLLSWRTFFGFIIAICVVYFFLRKFNIQSAIQAISNANPIFILISIFIFYISLPIRALRWQILLKPSSQKVDNKSLAHYYFLSWFANSILPARIGDIYRAYLLRKNKDVPVSLSLGVIFSERVFDLAVTATLVVLSGTYFGSLLQGTGEKNNLKWGLLATGGVVIIFVAAIFAMPLILKILPNKFKSIGKSFQIGIFKSPKLLPVIVLMTIAIWITEAFRLYFVFLALGIRPDFLMAIFISQASLVLMAIPITPAGLGFVENLMLIILSSLKLTKEMASAAVIVDRFISLGLLVISGFVVYLLSPRSR